MGHGGLMLWREGSDSCTIAPSSLADMLRWTALFLATFLVGCTSTVTTIERENRNPLTAQRYGEELADTLANLIIQQDDIAKNPANVARIQAAIADAKEIADDAARRLNDGVQGAFLQMQSSVEGYAFYHGDTLYFSPDFYVKPGIDLRVMLTEAVDPREGVFPDASAIDLGPIQRIEGAQVYHVSGVENPQKILSVVLWERSLGLLYSFAQLR